MASFAEEAPWSIYRRIPDTSTFADASELRFRAAVAPRIPDEGWSLPFHCRRRAAICPVRGALLKRRSLRMGNRARSQGQRDHQRTSAPGLLAEHRTSSRPVWLVPGLD